MAVECFGLISRFTLGLVRATANPCLAICRPQLVLFYAQGGTDAESHEGYAGMDQRYSPRSDLCARTCEDFGIAGRWLDQDQSAAQLDEGRCEAIHGRKQFANASTIGKRISKHWLCSLHHRDRCK